MWVMLAPMQLIKDLNEIKIGAVTLLGYLSQPSLLENGWRVSFLRGEGRWKFCPYKKPTWPQQLWIFPRADENLDLLVVIICCKCSP